MSGENSYQTPEIKVVPMSRKNIVQQSPGIDLPVDKF